MTTAAAFASFVRSSCEGLIRNLAETLDTPLAVLDHAGEVVLGAPDGCDIETARPADRSMAAPIEVGGDSHGSLVALREEPTLAPLLQSLAQDIGTRFGLERDLNHLTDTLSHSCDEINLLYRFARILRSDEEFEPNAHRLLEETADLLEHRLVVLGMASQGRFAWKAGPELEMSKSLSWVVSNQAILESVHAEVGRELREEGVGQQRRAGSLPSPFGVVEYMLTPVSVRSEVAGYAGLFKAADDPPFETTELRFLECLTAELGNAATARELQDELSELLFNVVQSLVAAIEAKDEYTRGHSQRVYQLSLRIGQRMGLPPQELQTLSWAALLHDIGKIAIDGQVLNKIAKLTEEEFQMIKSHPERGCRVLEPIPQLRGVLPGIRHHHERFDGKGYPDNLKGEEIPMLARIISVADSYDAIVSARAYRPARTKNFALDEVRQGAGAQFDPQVAQTMLELAVEGFLPEMEINRNGDSA
jgi:HD-GYP domain-containing protein (c-di-GMP phosphodiesterase class II)